MRTTLKLIALLSCIFLYSCQSNSKAEPLQETITPTEALRSELDTFYLGGKLVRVEKTSKSEFDHLTTIAVDTSEIKNLEIDAAFVKRTGDTLTIKTKTKEVQLVTNENDENDSDYFARYSYYGYIKSIDQWCMPHITNHTTTC